MRAVVARAFRWVRRGPGSCASGVAAVEFAMVAAPLLFLTGMMLELGIVYFHMNSLHQAVETAARQIRLNSLGVGRGNVVYDAACADLALISDCQASFFLDVRRARDAAPNPNGGGTFDGSTLRVQSSFRDGELAVARAYIRWDFVTGLPALLLQPVSTVGGNDFILSASTVQLVEAP